MKVWVFKTSDPDLKYGPDYVKLWFAAGYYLKVHG